MRRRQSRGGGFTGFGDEHLDTSDRNVDNPTVVRNGVAVDVTTELLTERRRQVGKTVAVAPSHAE